MKPSNKSITLIKEDFKVPAFYTLNKEKVVPMYADKLLPWKVLC